MKLNDPNRNRKAGFLGVAVATLLTPGGKLFTSAMAGALGIAGVALLAKDDPTSSGKSSAPTIAETSTPLNGAELLGLTDIPASESGYDPLTATATLPGNNQQVGLSGQPSFSTAGVSSATNVPASTSPVSNGVPGGMPQFPLGQPGQSGEPGEIPEPPAVSEPLAGPTNSPEDNPDEKPDELIIIAEAFPDDPLKGPDVLPPSPPPQDANNPLITDATPGIQALVPTAVSLPSTLALLLLGLASFGWVTRRTMK